MEQKRQKVAEEFQSSLEDLNMNSKPLINMLTILAEENIEHADVIVRVVEQHITKVLPEVKLPVLYLLDSIIKNVKREYISLFSACIVQIFCGVFEKVNEKVREKMYALRQTWNDVFSTQKLYALDVRVNCMDPNWPITAKVVAKQPAIHLNPNFLKSNAAAEDDIQAKTREILELQKRKLELELEATKARLEEQEKQLADSIKHPQMLQGIPRHNLVPVIPHSGQPPRNQMFHPYRMPMQRPPNMINNAHHNFVPGPQQAMQKVRMNPVNPALVNASRQRDPRLARQQQMQQQSSQPAPAGGRMNRNEEPLRSGLSKPDVQKVDAYGDKKRENRSKSTSYSERTKSRVGSGRHDRNLSSKIGSGSGSDGSKSPSRSSMLSKSSRSGSVPAKSSSRDKDSSRSSKDKTSSPEKKRSSSKNVDSSKSRNESSSVLKKEGGFKRPSRSPSSSPTKFKEFKHSIKGRNYIRKTTSKSPSKSPTKDVDLRPSICSPEKRVKHEDDIKPITSDITLPATKDLEKNTETQTCMDVDLRQFQAKKPASDELLPPASNHIKNEKSVNHNANSANSMVLAHIDMDTDLDKKRPMVDNTEEPEPKKSKTGKIDLLFGSEDVDLRTSALPLLAGTAHTDVMTPPPPPIISTHNEAENWNPIKDTSSNVPQQQTAKNKTSLEDVRAKLAKATKSQTKSREPLRKVKQIDQNEDSQDGKDATIRAIFSQAQQLFESENINTDEYSTIVKSLSNLNDTNKARRREHSVSSDNMEDIENEDSDKVAREAVLKKRIPKITKDLGSGEGKFEQNSILNRATPPSVAIDNSYNDKKQRTKSSKWSSATPWEQPNHKQQPMPVQPNANFNAGHQNAAPTSRAWINNAPGSNRAFNQRGNNRVGMPNPWQQPPAMGFANALGTDNAAVPRLSNSIDNPQTDLVRQITIDGSAKDIRVYGNIAIVFMSPNQPIEIGFMDGQRRIWIDDQEPLILDFNADFKQIVIGEETHRIRFGFPSRELFIDDDWYECVFGGGSHQIPIAGKLHILRAEGPPPKVNIGKLRHDLVVGKIDLYVDAHRPIPVFLDARPQQFDIQGVKHVIQFADALKTILIDNEPVLLEFGGLPKSMKLGENMCYVRLSSLPSGVVPGRVLIQDMIRFNKDIVIDVTPKLEVPVIDQVVVEPSPTTTVVPAAVAPPILPASVNIDALFQKLLSSGILNQAGTAISTNNNNKEKELVDTKKEIPIPKEKEIRIDPVDLSKTETIKTRQAGLVQLIFNGMQCSSCGVRFPPEQTIKYSQHLDWHFRQNRRDRDLTRKAHSRKWYYELSDWKQYEEIEDLEEREKNWFESQQNDVENCEEPSNQRTNSPPPSCPAGPEEVERACEVCHEKFEQFYNEELEEWHLRAAIRVDEKFYHPLCYEDYKASFTLDESAIVGDITVDDNAVDNVIIKKEMDTSKKSECMDEDDDDDVICVPMDEPSITEIPDDDEEYVPVSISSPAQIVDESDDSNPIQKVSHDPDVEIQEPHIPFTDLDTYVEKTLPDSNDESSQSSQLLTKIKEEPKDEYGEEDDDGFEDVGTVVVAVDEATVETLDDISQEIISSSPSNSLPAISDTVNTVQTTIDGNVELQDNIPATAVAVNKIKINITTNIVSNNNPSNNANKSNELNENSSNSSYNNSNISVIPVLCGGSSISLSSSINSNVNNNLGNKFNSDYDPINEDPSASPPSLSVAGNNYHNQQQQRHKSPTPPPIEDSIEYELKPALQNAKLKKIGKVKVGLETSGLCSIM